MKLVIENIFEPEKTVVIKDLKDDKNVILKGDREGKGPNLTMDLKTNSGFPIYINISKTACLVIKFVEE